MTIVFFSVLSASLETTQACRLHKSVWSTIELSFNAWFLAELAMRIAFCGNLCTFFTGWMNLIDVAAIAPYFLIQIIQAKNHVHGLLDIFRTLKFFRACRLFRFSRHSKRLLVAGRIVQTCMGSFRLMVTCFAVLVVFGGAVVLNVEETSAIGNRAFDSIPTAVWWSIQTLTTVGYGDLTPRTLVGRLFGCCFMFVGVITTSLPILTIVSQFVKLYPKNIELVTNSGEERLGGKGEEGIKIPRALRELKL